MNFKVTELMLIGSEWDLNWVLKKDISPLLRDLGKKLYDMEPSSLGVSQKIGYSFNDCIVDIYASGGGKKAAHNYGIAGESQKVDRTIKILEEGLSSISDLLKFQYRSDKEFKL